MAFALLSRSKRAAAVSRMPMHKRKSVPGRRVIDSQPGFERPASPLLATSPPGALAVQTKLKIGRPSDKFEQEADRVAEEVMRMPEPQALEGAAISGLTSPPHIQRVCPECEEELNSRPVAIQRICPECEKELHRQPLEEEEEETIQAKEISGRTAEVTSDVQAQINRLRGSGQPLPVSTRAFFEPRFGRNFGGVRVHTGAQAAEAARAVNARAFTVERDVVFGAGAYVPGTATGRHLLAHELTHVVQQGSSQRLGTEAVASTVQRASASDEALCEGTEFPPAAVWFSDPVLARIRVDEALMAFGWVGEPVALVQQALVAWGCDEGLSHPLPQFGVDGIFGSETQAAVKAFQTQQGIKDDGIVGRITMGELDGFILGGISTCPSGTELVSFVSESAPQTIQTVCLLPGTLPLGKGCPTPSTSGVTGIHQAVDNFSGRSTTRFGVGEVVNLSFDSPLSRGQPPGKKAVPHAGLQWVQTSGPGNLTNIDPRAGTGTFTADHIAGTVRLELQVVVGPCKGSTVAEVQFVVVRPNGVNIMEIPGTGPDFAGPGRPPIPAGRWGAGFQGRVFVDPKDVSFQGVGFAEGTIAGVVTPAGSYLNPLDGKVHPSSFFGFGQGGNTTTGTRVGSGTDDIFSGSRPPASTVSGVPICGVSDFLWAIPWEFTVPGTPRLIRFAIANHHATSTGSCEARIEKAGAGPVCRHIDGTAC